VIPQSSMRQSKLDLCIARMCGRTKQQDSQLALVVLLQLLEQFKKGTLSWFLQVKIELGPALPC
jgi:hypothetical protein